MAEPMLQVRIYDESNKRISYDSVKLQTEYTPNPKCTGTLHYFVIGSKVCTCKKYDGTAHDPKKGKK